MTPSLLGFAVLARLRPFLPTAFLALLLVYFTVQGFTGEGGLLRRDQRSAALIAKTRELAQVTRERRDLEIRAQLLRDESLSADLLEETARSLLGFADPRDYVIPLKP